ncbi:MAG TPA: zinc-ribbon domain-containing protein, partial [Kouleothrix sp.]|nr:zinc-ribbon domain-containing protein [Kouleothrix sp.]
MKCPTCGAENEAGNRFCEQCGSRLDIAAAAAPPPAVAPPAATSGTCPSCGATVLPGEAFCDECGASLSSAAPVAAAVPISDVPTVAAPQSPDAATDGKNVTCPSCGHQNLPGDRFCDNCGAALDQPAASTPAPQPAKPAAPP